MRIYRIFFLHGKFCVLRILRERGKPEILKRASKTGHRFTAILDPQNNEERATFQARNRQLSKHFPGKRLKSPVT